MTPYPKRLIEVDLPIARISAHARREKSIRHGHISTLHIWWARRPLAACRAVILASLWPDPVDLTEWLEEAGGKDDIRAPKNEDLKPGEGVVIRPKRFLDEARSLMAKWATRHFGKASGESYDNLIRVQKDASLLDDPEFLRTVLLDFIADFANWDNSTDADYLATSRALVQAAHEALGGEPGSRPMVIDPFAGGGSIPLEALRVGADAFASDLNPIPVLLNKVVLEYMPRHQSELASAAREWGEWIAQDAEQQLCECYQGTDQVEQPVAFIWARTVLTETPAVGADGQALPPVEIPLVRSFWLVKRDKRKRALRWVRGEDGSLKTTTENLVQADGRELVVRRPLLEIFEPSRPSDVPEGTVKQGSATCPVTGETVPVQRVRSQLKARQGGAFDARLIAIVSAHSSETGRRYRTPSKEDAKSLAYAAELFETWSSEEGNANTIPDEPFSGLEPRRIPLPQYGMLGYRDIFAPRQHLALVTLANSLSKAKAAFAKQYPSDFADALHTVLALAVSRHADMNASLAMWHNTRELVTHVFGRQAMPMVWDFAEANPTGSAGGSFRSGLDWVCRVLDSYLDRPGQVQQASATNGVLPDNAADFFFTDPPYYYSVPYSDLSDFFYVWLRRMLGDVYPTLMEPRTTPKELECVQNLPHADVADRQKTREFYEASMRKALSEGRRTTKPHGIGVVVFADTKTEAWEALLSALIDSGWRILGSWPLDTELATRILARRQSTLASSVHIVCVPRKQIGGQAHTDQVGEWRDVLAELPTRIEEWMPRLAAEGVVGADAVFACLGPALEIFSRYGTVEKASGEVVTLREYLEHVWAAVSSEALSMIFKDADAAGLEPDARLTAMWLWTVGGGAQNDADLDEVDKSGKASVAASYALEFDAARKIAQGLGIHLEKSADIVEVKGSTARLLAVSERIRHLFGNDATEETTRRGRRGRQSEQRNLFEELEAIEAEVESGGNGRFGGLDAAKPGATVLDKVHQSMVFFASGRSEALRRFLVDDGVGKDGKFWKLAQALSALYPNGTDEKRWVDGVLARKKGLGL